MEVQKFILEHGLGKLTSDYGIDCRMYANGYVNLSYSQIDSPKMNSMVETCRGLVLHVHQDNSSTVVCRPLKRFYNFGEANTGNFDFSDCVVQEKADGTMVKLYWSPFENQWIVGTRGMAYAEGNFAFSLTGVGGQFKDWILRAIGVSFEELQVQMEDVDRSVTFVLEYVGPENKIVVNYEKSHVVLLAVVSNETGEDEHTFPWFQFFEQWMNVRLPKIYSANSGDEIVKLADSLPNLEEGFVVFDRKTGNRVKIKSKVYCAVHHLRGNGVPSQSRLMEVVLMNEQDELLTYFPEFKQFVDPIKECLNRMIFDCAVAYNKFKGIESQKDFALSVKDYLFAPICFKARKDKVHVWEAFENMDLSQKIKLLEKYLEVNF